MAKKPPPRISLREWFERQLEPEDLLESTHERYREVTVRGDWTVSTILDPLPNPARERVRALKSRWREDCAGGVKVWGSRGAADAAVVEVRLSPDDWRRVLPHPTQNTMLLPGGAFSRGRARSIKWFNVQMEKDLVETLEHFRAAHPDATYLQTEQAIMKETGASQREVRAALGDAKLQRTVGRPKKQED